MDGQSPRRIGDLLHRRSDLSTFVIHWTRDCGDGFTPLSNLQSILASCCVKARNAYGGALHAINKSREVGDITQDESLAALESQHVVCFSETPLEQAWSFVGPIHGRSFALEPYGIAFTKKRARMIGLNPVWYLDASSGKGKTETWPIKYVEAMVRDALSKRAVPFANSPIAKLTPLIEVMGDWRKSEGTVKEFWWEREWRKTGDLKFKLEDVAVVLCPESEMHRVKSLMDKLGTDRKPPAVDPRWGLEHIIAKLAGVNADSL